MCDCISYMDGHCMYYDKQVSVLTHGCTNKGYNTNCKQVSETLHVVGRSLACPLGIDKDNQDVKQEAT